MQSHSFSATDVTLICRPTIPIWRRPIGGGVHLLSALRNRPDGRRAASRELPEGALSFANPSPIHSECSSILCHRIEDLAPARQDPRQWADFLLLASALGSSLAPVGAETNCCFSSLRLSLLSILSKRAGGRNRYFCSPLPALFALNLPPQRERFFLQNSFPPRVAMMGALSPGRNQVNAAAGGPKGSSRA